MAELDGVETVTTSTVITQILRLQQVLCGFTRSDTGEIIPIPNNRVSELMSILEETEGKCIIWANYQYDIRSLVSTIAEVHGNNSVASSYGETPAEDRAHRIGQTNKVTYIDLCAAKTIDEKIIKSLRAKINIATQILGEGYKNWLV